MRKTINKIIRWCHRVDSDYKPTWVGGVSRGFLHRVEHDVEDAMLLSNMETGEKHYYKVTVLVEVEEMPRRPTEAEWRVSGDDEDAPAQT